MSDELICKLINCTHHSIDLERTKAAKPSSYRDIPSIQRYESIMLIKKRNNPDCGECTAAMTVGAYRSQATQLLLTANVQVILIDAICSS